MMNENDLIKKLMVSKQIMEKHKQMPRTGNGSLPMNMDIPEVEEYSAPQAKYSLPEEFIQESKIPKQSPPQEMSQDRILSSKLPDEIKRLMIEHPISQPNSMAGSSISNDLVEKAARLMNTDASGKQVKQTQPKQQIQQQSLGIDAETIKSIVRETVEEVLSENGLLVESTSKSNEVFTFRVGKHIFEGKVTKIKKVQ
jgi:hypothetical protein